MEKHRRPKIAKDEIGIQHSRIEYLERNLIQASEERDSYKRQLDEERKDGDEVRRELKKARLDLDEANRQLLCYRNRVSDMDTGMEVMENELQSARQEGESARRSLAASRLREDIYLERLDGRSGR